MKHILIFFFTIKASLVLSQNTNSISVMYTECGGIVNLDEERRSVPQDNSITIIILRAETDPPNGVISPVISYLRGYDTSLVRIRSFEKRETNGSDFCKFIINSAGSKYPAVPIPSFLLLTASNQTILRHVREVFHLVPYFGDNSVLQLESIKDNKDFFEQLNAIITNYNELFVVKLELQEVKEAISKFKLESDNHNSRIRLLEARKPDTINGHKSKNISQLGLNFSGGSFFEYLKKGPSVPAHPNQSYKTQPFSMNLDCFYKRYLNTPVFIRLGLNFMYFNSSVYSQSIQEFPVVGSILNSTSHSINPHNPIANSSWLLGGISLSGGYTMQMKKYKAHLEVGAFRSGIIYGVSKANFVVEQGTPVIVKNSSRFSDDYSIGGLLSLNMEFKLNEQISWQIGGLLNGVICIMTPSANYQLVNSYGLYDAIENSSDRLELINGGITVGFLYNLK